MRLAVRVALAVALIGLAMTAGCSVGAPDASTDGGASGGIVTPSLTRDGGDRATAVGTLAYRRDLGGVFVLADIEPGQKPSPDARVIAILEGSQGQIQGADLGPLVGAYCAFSGRLAEEETSSSASAPKIAVESYRILKMPESGTP